MNNYKERTKTSTVPDSYTWRLRCSYGSVRCDEGVKVCSAGHGAQVRDKATGVQWWVGRCSSGNSNAAYETPLHCPILLQLHKGIQRMDKGLSLYWFCFVLVSLFGICV